MKVRVGSLIDRNGYRSVYVFSMSLFLESNTPRVGYIVTGSQEVAEEIVSAIFWYEGEYPGMCSESSLEDYPSLSPEGKERIQSMYKDGWGSCKRYHVFQHHIYYYDDYGRKHEVIVEKEPNS